VRPRVFLVDDEQPVLDGLTAALKKFFPDLELCGYAKSGRDAIEGVSREQPDVVLMDVRMPGMSGIDALRELKRLAPDTIPILLTAYERFDIAREAFELGVYDYLVKPVEQEDLIAAVRGALARNAERKEAVLRARSARQELEQARPFLEEAFLYAIILGETDAPGLDARARVLGFASADGRVGAAAPRRRPLRPESVEAATVQAFRNELAFRLPCAVGAPIRGIIPFFVPAGEAARAEKAVADAAADAATAVGEREFATSLGGARAAGELHEEWVQAVASLGEQAAEDVESWAPSEAMIAAAAEGDAAGAVAAFRAFAESAGAAGPVAIAAAAGHLLTFLGGDAADAVELGRRMAVAAPLSADAYAAALAAAIAAIGAAEGGRSAETDKRVRIALAFIAESYASPISLDDAAEKVGLSAARLSRLLTEETGKSFMEHLTEARLDRARSELARGRASIKEIAAECGYPDANYFSRAFKKAVGLTPSEYANRHGRSII